MSKSPVGDYSGENEDKNCGNRTESRELICYQFIHKTNNPYLSLCQLYFIIDLIFSRTSGTGKPMIPV